jgi:SMC interacting uncharacterized protein involved in chromosome segregation
MGKTVEDVMTRKETIDLIGDLKGDIKGSIQSLEKKVDIATEHILRYAEKSAVLQEKVARCEEDIDHLADKCRVMEKKIWTFSGAVLIIGYLIEKIFSK